uniref:RNA polymerase alpha subunit n=1 Tax=Chlorococcum tatrense TaxID=915274 RepID=UPI0010C4F6D5|nr:RNA polymerase alpha subunit [Chlorococcum tatrense]AYQ94318.1 RNA polymerase alpha subunit [Chlorococcum tatrense]
MNNVFISCKESRIENNRSFYGCFNLGTFDAAQSLTVANALRRTLLSECPGLGIISVTIENVSHEYSTLPGMRESVLDLLLNLKEIVFCSGKRNNFNYSDKSKGVGTKLLRSEALQELRSSTTDVNKSELIKDNEKTTALIYEKTGITSFQSQRGPKKPIVGYLKVKGPGVIRAKDLKLPPLIQCVDPDQYIATLAEDGFLCMKFIIMEGKGYLIQKSNSFIDNTLVKKRANLLSSLKSFKSDGLSTVRSNPFSIGEEEILTGFEKEGAFVLGQKTPFLKNLPERVATLSSSREEARRMKGFEKEGPLNVKAKRESESKPLNLDCVFNPVTKVSYIIEDFDNKVTNDFNQNLNFVNDFSSLIESSHYLKKNLPFLLIDSTKGTMYQQKEISLNGKTLSNLIETYTKYEMQELSSYLHPLKKQNSLHNIVLEIWTNGSLHPREALALGFQNLGSLFLNLQKTKVF